MKFLNSFKRALCAAFATVATCGVALAEGEGSGAAATVTPIAWEGSNAQAIANAAQTTLSNFLTGVGGIVGLLIVAGLAIWGGIALVGVLKRAFSTGKGR